MVNDTVTEVQLFCIDAAGHEQLLKLCDSIFTMWKHGAN